MENVDFKVSREANSKQTISMWTTEINFGFLAREKIEMIGFMEGSAAWRLTKISGRNISN
jgi:hypothetical protein